MARLDRSRGVVLTVDRVVDGALFATVRHDHGGTSRAIAWTDLTGAIEPGDRVLCNTTAVSLGLGTGGYDVVIAVEPGRAGGPVDGREHIVKVRYTASQHAVVPAEHDPRMAEAIRLDDVPVVVCGLHSQILPAVAGARSVRGDVRIALVQTDTGALPVAFSNVVRELKERGWIATTISSGQAFGADLECVSLASALQAARVVAGADLVVVSQGPGNAGTGTPYGFSGIEQGAWCDAAGAMGARVVAVARCSDADPRPRHRGISHHTITALGTFAARRAMVALPSDRPDLIATARGGVLGLRHDIVPVDTNAGLAVLRASGMRPSSMGRSLDDDPVCFAAAVAAGIAALCPEEPRNVMQPA